MDTQCTFRIYIYIFLLYNIPYLGVHYIAVCLLRVSEVCEFVLNWSATLLLPDWPLLSNESNTFTADSCDATEGLFTSETHSSKQ